MNGLEEMHLTRSQVIDSSANLDLAFVLQLLEDGAISADFIHRLQDHAQELLEKQG